MVAASKTQSKPIPQPETVQKKESSFSNFNAKIQETQSKLTSNAQDIKDLLSKVPINEQEWTGMPTDQIHKVIETQTEKALKASFELFPFFELVNVHGD